MKISDIAKAIKGTLPSVTKNIATLEELGYMKKQTNKKDRRIINVDLTDKGLALYRKDVSGFHEQNAEILQEISIEDMDTTIRTIKRIYELMSDSMGYQKGKMECIEH